MADINEAAEKKLKARMTKIRKCNREPEEKAKFSEKIGISLELEFQNKNPDKLTDGITIITSPEGKVLFADYFYGIPEEEEYTNVEITEKQLKSIIEFFDDYKLELDDSDQMIINDSLDEVKKRENALSIIKSIVENNGRDFLFDLTGLSGGFIASSSELSLLETYVGPAIFEDALQEVGIAHMVGEKILPVN